MAENKTATKRATTKRTGSAKRFTAEERAAMKERAKELKAEAAKADGEKALLEKVAEMKGTDRDLATRLQQRAVPDTILCSAPTYALVQGEVQGEAEEALMLDTAATPAPVYAIRSLRRRRAGVPRRGARPLSRFVGRTQELALLHERLGQAASGQGQVIGIAGEPGMGKSRLLAEFAHRLAGQSITYCEGHCLAYGSVTPYLPVRDLL